MMRRVNVTGTEITDFLTGEGLKAVPTRGPIFFPRHVHIKYDQFTVDFYIRVQLFYRDSNAYYFNYNDGDKGGIRTFELRFYRIEGQSIN